MLEATAEVATKHVPPLPVTLVEHIDVDIIRQPEVRMPHPASNDGQALGVEAHTAPAAAGTTTPDPRIREHATP
eukprot:2675852-Alexandrium_andersonii.AAC.1